MNYSTEIFNANEDTRKSSFSSKILLGKALCSKLDYSKGTAKIENLCFSAGSQLSRRIGHIYIYIYIYIYVCVCVCVWCIQ